MENTEQENLVKQYDTLALSEPHPNVTFLEITREASANTLSAQLCRDLLDTVDRLVHSETKVVIITGRGRFFSAGADLRDPEHGPGWIDMCRRGLDAFATLPIPTIAAINGHALGGGTELALTCDFRIAADDAVLGLPEITFGALPGGGGLSRLQRAVGPTEARRLVYTGRRVDAAQAHQIGLVDSLTGPDRLTESALTLASEISRHARYSLVAAKAIFHHADAHPGSPALPMEYRTIDRMASPEELSAERARAADRDPRYARIFSTTGDTDAAS